MKLPPLPGVEFGHRNEPPSRVLGSADWSFGIVGKLVVFDSREGYPHPLALHAATARRFVGILFHHPHVGVRPIHGRDS